MPTATSTPGDTAAMLPPLTPVPKFDSPVNPLEHQGNSGSSSASTFRHAIADRSATAGQANVIASTSISSVMGARAGPANGHGDDEESEDEDVMFVSMEWHAPAKLNDELPPQAVVKKESSSAPQQQPHSPLQEPHDHGSNDAMYIDMTRTSQEDDDASLPTAREMNSAAAASSSASALTSAPPATYITSIVTGRPHPINLNTWRWAAAANIPLPKRDIGGWKVLTPWPRARPSRGDADIPESGAMSYSTLSTAALEQRRNQILDVDGFLRRAAKLRSTGTSPWSDAAKAECEKSKQRGKRRGRSTSRSPPPNRCHYPLPKIYADLLGEIRDEERASSRWASRMISEACDVAWDSDDDADHDDPWQMHHAPSEAGSSRFAGPSDRGIRLGSTVSSLGAMTSAGGAVGSDSRERRPRRTQGVAPTTTTIAAAVTRSAVSQRTQRRYSAMSQRDVEDLWSESGPSMEIQTRRKTRRRGAGPAITAATTTGDLQTQSERPRDSLSRSISPQQVRQPRNSGAGGSRPSPTSRGLSSSMPSPDNAAELRRNAEGMTSAAMSSFPSTSTYASTRSPAAASSALPSGSSRAAPRHMTIVAPRETTTASSFGITEARHRPELQRRRSSGETMDAAPIQWDMSAYNSFPTGRADSSFAESSRRRRRRPSASDTEDEEEGYGGNNESFRNAHRREGKQRASGSKRTTQGSRSVASARGVTPASEGGSPPYLPTSRLPATSSWRPLSSASNFRTHAQASSFDPDPRSRSSSIEMTDGQAFQAALAAAASHSPSKGGTSSSSPRRPGASMGGGRRRRKRMSSAGSISGAAGAGTGSGGVALASATGAGPMSTFSTGPSSSSSLSSSQRRELQFDRRTGTLLAAPQGNPGARNGGRAESTTNGSNPSREIAAASPEDLHVDISDSHDAQDSDEDDERPPQHEETPYRARLISSFSSQARRAERDHLTSPPASRWVPLHSQNIQSRQQHRAQQASTSSDGGRMGGLAAAAAEAQELRAGSWPSGSQVRGKGDRERPFELSDSE
ncbi:hypothetical protein BDZ90DRAFT_234887 [Jaminaea rosea]|uniref:Rrn9 domain-containing protein n=1 Tax=Jaminaea rosea TaxID=1569628 RepID=A0A316UH78_9BASI|nr:hypothetical protein BDZ90DRAFT_234887 [Jaminaea rosea]PWN24616.1 hypothetical protein BDZ90DRAFT_234887 [Jaminaea rosea]